jgi:fructokinase
VAPGGEPRFTIADPVAWDFIPLTPDVLALARRADAMCYGTLAQRSAESRRTIRTCLEAAPPGCLRVFDVNLRDPFVDPARLEETLAVSDVLKLNETELPRVAGWLHLPEDETAALDALLQRYALRLIAVTKGARGSRLRGRAGDSVHPGFRVPVVDTVGAGDSFTAAVIIGLLDGQSLDEINERANRVASLVCGHAGAVPPAELVP